MAPELQRPKFRELLVAQYRRPVRSTIASGSSQSQVLAAFITIAPQGAQAAS